VAAVALVTDADADTAAREVIRTCAARPGSRASTRDRDLALARDASRTPRIARACGSDHVVPNLQRWPER
jgi:hypothetical protein